MHHGDATVAGYSITTRLGRVWLVDQQPTSDPGMNADQARQLAEALTTAAATADRQTRPVSTWTQGDLSIDRPPRETPGKKMADGPGSHAALNSAGELSPC